MKNQILTLMIGASVLTANLAFAMDGETTDRSRTITHKTMAKTDKCGTPIPSFMAFLKLSKAFIFRKIRSPQV